MKKTLINFLCLLVLFISYTKGPGSQAIAEDWQETLTKAKGQTVFWHAWGGSPTINSYIDWIGEEVYKLYGIKLHHTKVVDTAHVVSKVLAEKTAGKDTQGSVDLVWINGENLRSMTENGLLFGPFAQRLPNFSYVDTKNKPTTLVDFTIPTDGYESPWGMAYLNLIYESERRSNPPPFIKSWLTYEQNNPGRLSYPAPPDFIGSTFLKQVLYATIDNPADLQQPPKEENLARNLASLFTYLDQLNPYLWQQGKNYPKDLAELERLLGDREIDIAISFNPGQASEAVNNGRLPASVRTYVMEEGAIGNTHFVAIPYNAKAKEGAQVVANFLLSPAAQLRKNDPTIWGDPTVLAIDKLPAVDQRAFINLDMGPAGLLPQDINRVLPEPHPLWMEAIEEMWLQKYAR